MRERASRCPLLVTAKNAVLLRDFEFEKIRTFALERCSTYFVDESADLLSSQQTVEDAASCSWWIYATIRMGLEIPAYCELF
jgi:predicted RNA-binding Zn ribbon-like protein